MKINHIGIVNRDRIDAEKFYINLLEFELKYEFILQRDLSEFLFGHKSEIPVLILERGNIVIEIFIVPDFINSIPNIPHICIQTDNLEEYLELLRRNGVELITFTRDGKEKYFIKDLSNNLIEMK
ncbi:MAG: hypothetical protein PHV06_01395 [bacterium]|nr:hypothetical protein [bacterium]